MSTQKPDSNPADIYRKLISLNQRQPARTVSRTTVHNTHNRAVQYKVPVKRPPLCVRIPTRDAWAEHKTEDKSPCLYTPNKRTSPSPSPYRASPSPYRASYRPHTSCGASTSTSYNSSLAEDEMLPAPPPSPTRNKGGDPCTEVYDVDMVTAWSSFDLKSYELTLQPPTHGVRAKSAPIKQRRELQCNTATLLYDKQIHARQAEHKFRPSSSASRCSSRASNQQAQSILQSTFQSPQFQQRMVKFLQSPADFELLLQALKLERCVPRGASEAMLRKNLQSILATL